MPDDNVWLTHRTAERDALLQFLATMQATPGRAVQGAGTPNPVPSRRHRPYSPAPARSPTRTARTISSSPSLPTSPGSRSKLRQQTQALRDALAQAHGENLDLRRELARRGGSTQTPSDAR